MKEALLQDLTRDRDQWLDVLNNLDQGEHPSAPVCDDGRVQDIVGHLAYWEHQTLDHIRQTLNEGRPHPLSETDTDEDLNGREVAKRKTWTRQRVRVEFANTREALIQRVAGLGESDLGFYVPSPWVNDTRFITVEQMIREDVLGHSRDHRTRAEEWHKQHRKVNHLESQA